MATVNAVLPLNLRPGEVHFSVSAQRHANVKHPRDFPICIENIHQIVRSPDWVGQGPHDKDGFVLVRRVVASTYRLTEHDVKVRVAKGFLSPI